MKRLILALCILLSTQIKAQNVDNSIKAEAYKTPSVVHDFLAKYDGEWMAEITFFISENMEDKIHTSGKAKSQMIYGGLYQQTDVEMNIDDKISVGRSMLAWDNANQSFISTWIDDMGTGILVMEGVWDEAYKSILLEGQMYDPMLDDYIQVVQEHVFVDLNTQIMRMYSVMDSTQMQTMEVLYTRKK